MIKDSRLEDLVDGIIVEPDGCWSHELAPDTLGYHVWGVGEGKQVSGHRLIFQILRGPFPSWLQLDHLCRFRGCVNPWHLEPVSQGENVRRAVPYRNDMTPFRQIRPVPSGVARDRKLFFLNLAAHHILIEEGELRGRLDALVRDRKRIEKEMLRLDKSRERE